MSAKVTDLTSASALSGGEVTNIVQGGVDKKMEVSASGGANKIVATDGAGNVGLGTVTSFADNTVKTLELGATGNFFGGFNGGAGLYHGINTYFNAGWKYAATGIAQKIEQNSGVTKISRAISGTSNGVIAWIDDVVIDAAGNLLVGVTSGSYHNFVKNNSASGVLRVENTANNASDYSIVSVLGSNVNVANGTHFAGFTGGTERVRIYGNGTIQNSTNLYQALSDIKLKQDIVDVDSQWGDIKGLRLRKYHLKDDPTGILHLGLIAQEVELVSPGLVNETPDYELVKTVDNEGNEKEERVATGETTKAVKYSILYLKAVGALQEAMSRIESLEARLELLENK